MAKPPSNELMLQQPAFLALSRLFAERTTRIIFWVGAGLSFPANVPLWSGLKEKLLAAAAAKADTLASAEQRKANGLTRRAKAAALWESFELLKEALGPSTYREQIRFNLKTDTSAIPKTVYPNVWDLAPAGIVSLNLDKLASSAFGSVRSGIVNEFTGSRLAAHLHLLQSPERPFLVQLHGSVDDHESWVFTPSELAKLKASPAYQAFVATVFTSHVVVFLGVSADDRAAGGLLAEMRDHGLDLGNHFWITDRRGSDTDSWAERAGIQVIRYDSTNGHTAPVVHLLDALKKAKSVDSVAPPVVGKSTAPSSTTIPPPAQLATMEPESIRLSLASEARRILGSTQPDSDKRSEYDKFCTAYKRAIWNAWFVSTDPPENICFGYVLERSLGEGAFGNVYEAIRPSDGASVALKLLLSDVFSNKDMLGSYRRGVRSHQKITAAGVPGVAKFIDAYELPPCLAMEYIDGPTLERAVREKRLDFQAKLRVLRDAAAVVHMCHRLPDRVLHRDLRPPNILLEGFDIDPLSFQAKIVDFDLSWHRGALEKSVFVGKEASLVYLAPEQLQDIPGASTRHSAVDAYGFGMTIYYALAEAHPPVAMTSGTSDAHAALNDIIAVGQRSRSQNWTCLPTRLARLIHSATRHDQTIRWDFSEVMLELDRLHPAELDPSSCVWAELWAEEIAARAFGIKQYSWDADQLAATVKPSPESFYKFESDEIKQRVVLSVEWKNSGPREWKNLTQRLRDLSATLKKITQIAHWDQTSVDVGQYQIFARTSVNLRNIPTRIGDLVKGVNEVQSALSRL